MPPGVVAAGVGLAAGELLAGRCRWGAVAAGVVVLAGGAGRAGDDQPLTPALAGFLASFAAGAAAFWSACADAACFTGSFLAGAFFAADAIAPASAPGQGPRDRSDVRHRAEGAGAAVLCAGQVREEVKACTGGRGDRGYSIVAGMRGVRLVAYCGVRWR